VAIPGSRPGNRDSRGEGQGGYPRPNSNNRPLNPGAGQPYRRPPAEEERGGNRPMNPGMGQPYRRPPAEEERSSAPFVRPAVTPGAAPAPVSPPAMKGLLTDEIRELIQLMAASDLTEINIENGLQRVLIRREPAKMVMQEYAPPAPRGKAGRGGVAAPAPTEVAPISDPGSPPEDSFHKITAPMVGTFYSASDPKGKPFVQQGDMVEKGQVIGIIEAMKIMNEIQSEHGGRCMRVTVENGQPVEYGQTLLVLEPA